MLLAVILMAGVFPGAAHAAHQAAAKVLYQWKFPTKGHTGAWTFAKGIMTFAGDSPGYAFPAIKLKNATNFAVEASMRSSGPGGVTATLTGFGVIVGRSTSNPHTSISGGSFFAAQSEDNNPELYAGGDTIGGAALDPGTSWHTYRLEVHANLYTLRIDGKQMVQYPIDGLPSATRAGVFSLYRPVQVRSFRVLALPPAGGAASPMPLLKPLQLTLGDLPTNDYFQPLMSHYTTNVEAAREGNVSVQSLEAGGRISAYTVQWFPWGTDLSDLYSGITAFTTAADAQASNVSRLQAFQQQFGGFTNFQLLPDQHVGDTSGGIRLDFTVQGQVFNVVAVLFTHGSYSVLVRALFYGGALSQGDELAKAVALAKIIDGRISSRSPVPRRSARTSQHGR